MFHVEHIASLTVSSAGHARFIPENNCFVIFDTLGVYSMSYDLLTVGGNAKIVKSDAYLGGKYRTATLSLAPSDYAREGATLCPLAELAGCRSDCLFHQGRARTFSNINRARVSKALLFLDDPKLFLSLLCADLWRFGKRCKKLGVQGVTRLNCLSDIDWQKYIDFSSEFPGIIFYDYEKVPRVSRHDNYFLVWSFSAADDRYIRLMNKLPSDMRIAVVFDTPKGRPLPEYFIGRRVVDGDEHDLVFLYPKGSVIGLRAKGSARKTRPPFVVPVADIAGIERRVFDLVPSMGGFA